VISITTRCNKIWLSLPLSLRLFCQEKKERLGQADDPVGLHMCPVSRALVPFVRVLPIFAEYSETR
jgi:hypothetical protein